PRFVNELVNYAICGLEQKLAGETAAELRKRPLPPREHRVEALDRRLQKLDTMALAAEDKLAHLDATLPARSNWLCRFLFNEDLSTVMTYLPASDLRESFVRPLPRSRLALFGQYAADLLPNLVREEMHQFEGGEDYWLSVPYDANIGVFVVRLDLLEREMKDE